MSYADESIQIQQRLTAQLPTIGIAADLVAWPNETFPGNANLPDPASLWISLSILNGEAFQNTILAQTNNHRHPGVIIIQVHAPLNAGNGAALAKASLIATAFRNWCGTTVRCRAVSVKEIGEKEGFYLVNVSIPFHRDELF